MLLQARLLRLQHEKLQQEFYEARCPSAELNTKMLYRNFTSHSITNYKIHIEERGVSLYICTLDECDGLFQLLCNLLFMFLLCILMTLLNNNEQLKNIFVIQGSFELHFVHFFFLKSIIKTSHLTLSSMFFKG